MAELAFDATAVEPAQPFEVIPAGKYKVHVVASEMRPTKNGDGQYLWLELEILEGEYQGRRLWDRLNLANSNSQAVEIGQRALSALCHAVGELHVADSEVLHLKPVLVTVRVKPAKDDYAASNDIRGYSAVAGFTAPPAATVSPATATSVAATATKTPPWRQKKADDEIPY